MDDLHVTAPPEGGEEETYFGGHFEPRNVRSYSVEGAGQLVKERKREGGTKCDECQNMYSNWSNDSCDKKKINSGTVISLLCCSSTKRMK